MKKNTNTKNLCRAWDLTEAELETFYRGAGKVSIAIDERNNIVACVYHGMQPSEAALLGALAQMQLDHPRALKADGAMSCHQFCEP